MSTLPRPSPIERFLGEAAAVPGPLNLLGLTPQTCDPEHVLTALDRQLQRVDMHPEGDTPEADEVRLALHAAAAQLLDPVVRQHLLAAAGAGPDAATSAMPPLAPGQRPGLDYEALLVLAQSGGWNQDALRRLAMLASARGLPSTAVTDTLRQLGRHGHGRAVPIRPAAPTPPPPPPPQRPAPAAASAQVAHPAPPPRKPLPEREPRRLDPAIIAGGIFLGAILLITLLSMALMAARRGGPPTTPRAAAPAATGAGTAPAPAAPSPAPTSTPAPPTTTTTAAPTAAPESAPQPSAPRFKDAAAALRALRASAAALRSDDGGDNDALTTFTAATEWIAGWWCRLDVAQLRASSDATVEFIYAAAPWPEISAAAVDALARLAAPLAGDDGIAPQQVWPAAWAAGTLLRLTRERDLPAELASRIERTLVRALGPERPRRDPTFEAGATAALARLPEKLILPAAGAPALPGPPLRDASDGSAPVARWIEAVRALNADQDAQERLLIDGLERIMVAAEPDADRRVYDAIGLLAVEIRWRRGGPARARLVDWFRDARISSGDLNVLTTAMASGSSAEGVTQAMVLPWAAGFPERERLRAEYAAAWSIAEGAARDSTAQRWVAAASALLQRDPPTSHLHHLAAAAHAAALNRAARALWSGNNADADALTAAAERTAERALSRITLLPRDTGSVLRPQVSTDGQWAAAFLAAGQNRQLRLERLAELERIGGGLGPADAETLVDAACFASPVEVRTAAQNVVLRHAREAVIVNALLETLPKAPRIRTISDMIEQAVGTSLPSPTDPEWMFAARRALVVRLSQLIAAGGATGGVDDVALMIRTAYGLPEQTDPGATDLSAYEPATEVRDLWNELRPVADSFLPNPHAPIPLDRVESRRAGRAALASGPVQAWAAEQISLAELMSFVVAGEQPSRAPAVKRIMDDLAAARRRATHIFEQISATETAIMRLWLLRYGQETTWSGG